MDQHPARGPVTSPRPAGRSAGSPGHGSGSPTRIRVTSAAGCRSRASTRYP